MDLEHKAIERLKVASEMSLTYYEQPLIITTSGGKDSDICLELAHRSGIPYEVQHSLTTADAPQTIYHVREQLRELELQSIKCKVSKPMYKGKRVSMWTLIPQMLTPPTRISRYCCTVLKEQAGVNRMITTGVRWAESVRRKTTRGIYENIALDPKKRIILNNDNDEKRMLFENCKLRASRVCNPIIEWTDRDVWDFIRSEKIPMNLLYSMGFNRVGCIGCPMAEKKRYLQFRTFPTYQTAYIKTFDRMVEARIAKGKLSSWKDGNEVFQWWMNENPDQITFAELAEMGGEEE